MPMNYHLTVNRSPSPPHPATFSSSWHVTLGVLWCLRMKKSEVTGIVNTLIHKEYMTILKNHLASQLYKWFVSEKESQCLQDKCPPMVMTYTSH